jgi:site-specific DNA-cytosine methylase
MKKIILSLFDYSGNWPKYYRDSGLYDVYQVDVKLGLDILDITPGDLPQPIHGILAAPPCTDFASSGAQYWSQKDRDGRTQQSLQLVDKTLEIISYHEPKWWVIENPVGRLAKLRPELGTPWYFQPWWFGDPYTKKTGLWGTFNRDLPQSPVDPDPKSPIMQLGGKSERTKELRSMTPLGFALAFYLANP